MKILSILLSLQMILLPIIVYAEPKSTTIKKDQKAPFSGLLLNLEAQSKILSEKQKQQEKCKLDMDFSKKKSKLNCDFQLMNSKVEYDALKRKYEVTNKLKDKELDKLRKVTLKKEGQGKWWLLLGGVVGVTITVAVFLLAGQAIKLNR